MCTRLDGLLGRRMNAHSLFDLLSLSLGLAWHFRLPCCALHAGAGARTRSNGGRVRASSFRAAVSSVAQGAVDSSTLGSALLGGSLSGIFVTSGCAPLALRLSRSGTMDAASALGALRGQQFLEIAVGPPTLSRFFTLSCATHPLLYILFSIFIPRLGDPSSKRKNYTRVLCLFFGAFVPRLCLSSSVLEQWFLGCVTRLLASMYLLCLRATDPTCRPIPVLRAPQLVHEGCSPSVGYNFTLGQRCNVHRCTSWTAMKQAPGACVWIDVSRRVVNWQLIAHACASISTRIAAAYDTLGPAGLTHSLNEPSCAAVFTNTTVLAVLPDTPSVKFVLFDGDVDAKLVTKLREVRGDVQVFSVAELRERGQGLGKGAGKKVEEVKRRRPGKETFSSIMYTSGSTCAPKGVVITHANLVASVRRSSTLLLGHHLTPEDAYLPLAHILEFIVEIIMLFVGMLTGFGGVKTLTDASVRDCYGDIKAFLPSIMVGIPAV
ncbi:AMP-binding enzyme-domain-containing protein [Mycena sanguinolenta]|nr:AMP-binding enzyme-domain-containing protein [Mycena sanguinolenta]